MLDMPGQNRRAVNDRRVVAERRGETERRGFLRRCERIPIDVDWRMDARRSGSERRVDSRRLTTDRRGGLAVAF